MAVPRPNNLIVRLDGINKIVGWIGSQAAQG